MQLRYILPAYLALISAAVADDVVAGNKDDKTVAFHPTTVTAPFVEQFTTGWDKRWIPSHTKKVVDGVEDEDLLHYKGRWAVEQPDVIAIAGDEGLVVKDAASHHAITAKFPTPIDPTGKSFVAQYEVKLQNGLECGGAYMKLLTADSSFDQEKFADKTPYTIMFGPDKCGLTNKVHFIFRHTNPKTGEIEEKHLNAPPAAKTDKNTHLYTLIVNPDQTFRILIDNEEVKKGSLLEDFTPAVNPPKEIDDPSDTKPADWVDEEKIVDPEATKPEDWDEEAPLEVVDEDAKKPADWLDNESTVIPDPETEKPEDWDDEEDGEWVAPSIPNPKCEKASGCGEWKRPMKRNPAYKGKWTAPLIDNPLYKGVWAPKKIANPNYFEDKTPSNFNKIGAIGFEIWTMQNGILFDNIYVGHSEKDANKLAQESFAVKHKIEQAKEDEVKKAAEKLAKEKPVDKVIDSTLPLIEKARAYVDKYADLEYLHRFFDRARVSPLDAVKELPWVAAAIVGSLVVPLFIMSLVFGAPAPAKKAPVKGAAKAAPVKKAVIVEKEVVVEQVVEKKGNATKRNAAKKAESDSE
ncbi:calreticulin [Fimicolochytrium jonesii]|uniref:calreticulin n=1 Tax=Fimicolochytrium jonesii TaxID=1396493 RepID=UPI0022FDEEFC|nr:calreticulin [Fimicolochytrium jonesii]KAI8823064.1 calreticulin [Fimicolochytrium jonesii]